MAPLCSDSDISGFIHNLEAQDIKVELMKQNDYMAAAPHSAAINVTGSSKVRERGGGRERGGEGERGRERGG